jgi:Na+:H+ antiporter, NhaA family
LGSSSINKIIGYRLKRTKASGGYKTAMFCRNTCRKSRLLLLNDNNNSGKPGVTLPLPGIPTNCPPLNQLSVKENTMKITRLFKDFFDSEKSGGLILIVCTLISLLIANSGSGEQYIHFWHTDIGSRPIEFWINDGLMTIFFLLIGLEMEREIYIGELASIRGALLPVSAALGGMLVPALIHWGFNHGTPYQNGMGIPMATDIAFSLGILSLLGNKVPTSVKIFLTALAIIDDLGAIAVIAIFYSKGFSVGYFGAAALIFAGMIVMNRLKVHRVLIYLVLGGFMWYCMLHSGIHATITGVLLAFAIPFGNGDKKSPSYHLQHQLHRPVAFVILPLFALANTCIHLPPNWTSGLFSTNSLGIMTGLLIGKPIGIVVFSILSVVLGLSVLPEGLRKKDLWGIGLLAGIGFTMSIFITLLAFEDADLIAHSKIAVLAASLLAGLLGFLVLQLTLPNVPVAEEVVEEIDPMPNLR